MNTKNQYFDIIIIGALGRGYLIGQQLNNLIPERSIAIVSSHWPILPVSFKKTHITTINSTINYLSYTHGLIGLTCNTESSPTLFCSQLILATGTKNDTLETLKVKGSNANQIYYNCIIGYEKKFLKTDSCVVIGSNKKAIRLALLASRRFKRVYFCPCWYRADSELKSRLATLQTHSNIDILPGGLPLEIKTDTMNNATAVIFDTGADIPCDAVFVALDGFPDVDWIPSQFVSKGYLKYLQVDDDCRSYKVPTIYACGELVSGYNTKTERRLINAIINQKIGRRPDYANRRTDSTK